MPLTLLGSPGCSGYAAILIWLGLQYPQSGLLPETEGERALAIRCLVFIAVKCYTVVSVFGYPA